MATVAKFATVQAEGGRDVTRQVEYYDLDMILSVGYRVMAGECRALTIQLNDTAWWFNADPSVRRLKRSVAGRLISEAD